MGKKEKPQYESMAFNFFEEGDDFKIVKSEEKAITAKTQINEDEEIKKSVKKKETKNKYMFPFGIFSEGKEIDVSNYGFVEQKEYTEDEICEIMLTHRHYEFSAEHKFFKYIKESNLVYYSGSDFKKG